MLDLIGRVLRFLSLLRPSPPRMPGLPAGRYGRPRSVWVVAIGLGVIVVGLSAFYPQLWHDRWVPLE